MSHQLLRSLLMVCAIHSFAVASDESSSNSSSSSTARSVIKTPKLPPIDVGKALILMLPPDPPPMGLDDEAEKKGTFASKSDREKSELLQKIYEAYKYLEPEEAGGSFYNADGTLRIIKRPIVNIDTAVFEGDLVKLMIAKKVGTPAIRYQYDRKTGDLIIAPTPLMQCPQAYV